MSVLSYTACNIVRIGTNVVALVNFSRILQSILDERSLLELYCVDSQFFFIIIVCPSTVDKSESLSSFCLHRFRAERFRSSLSSLINR